MPGVKHFLSSMSQFALAVFAVTAFSSCNQENLEPLLQGSWDGASPGWTQLGFSNGRIVLKIDPKTPVQGQYKLEGKTLKFELYKNLNGKKIKLSEPATAAIEKLDGNSLELNLKGQRMQFFKNNP
jgi:hypothetical protein